MRGLLLTLLLLPAAVLAADNPSQIKLGSPGLTYSGLTAERGNVFTDQLAVELEALGVRVITAKQITALLGNAREKAVLGCGDDASAQCMIELANAVGVDGLITGSLARFGDSYQLNVVVVSARDGAMLGSFSSRADGERALMELLGTAARSLGPDVGRALHKPVVTYPHNVLSFNAVSWAEQGFSDLNLTYERTLNEHFTVFVEPHFSSRQGTLTFTGGTATAQLGQTQLGVGLRWYAYGPAPSGVWVGARFDSIANFNAARQDGSTNTAAILTTGLGVGTEAGYSFLFWHWLYLSGSAGADLAYAQGFNSTTPLAAAAALTSILNIGVNAGVAF